LKTSKDVAFSLVADLNVAKTRPGSIARNTLANANATRDWRIYCDFAQSLIATARSLYADASFGLDLQDTVYALRDERSRVCGGDRHL
jgi:hypothetical protein